VAKIDQLAAKIEEARGLRQQAIDDAKHLITSLHMASSASRNVTLTEILELDEEREPVEPGREYPQIGLRGFGAGLFAKPSVKAEETTYKSFNRLYEGTLVLSQFKGWEGAIGLCPREFVGRFASPEYRTFRCLKGAALP